MFMVIKMMMMKVEVKECDFVSGILRGVFEGGMRKIVEPENHNARNTLNNSKFILIFFKLG